MKRLLPLAQSVSKNASKMNSTTFRTPILSKDNFMSPKSEKHMITDPDTWRMDAYHTVSQDLKKE